MGVGSRSTIKTAFGPMPFPVRRRLDAPPGLAASEYNGDVTITWSWRKGWLAAFFVLLCMWNTAAVVVIVDGGAPIGFIVTHGGTALLATGVFVVLLVNRTTIRLSGGALEKRYGPLRWPGCGVRRLDLGEIHDVRVLVFPDGSNRPGAEVHVFHFDLHAPSICVADQLRDHRQAEFVCGAIRQAIGA